MPFEYKSIKEAVSQVWSTFRANSKLEEDDELYAQIIKKKLLRNNGIHIIRYSDGTTQNGS